MQLQNKKCAFIKPKSVSKINTKLFVSTKRDLYRSQFSTRAGGGGADLSHFGTSLLLFRLGSSRHLPIYCSKTRVAVFTQKRITQKRILH